MILHFKVNLKGYIENISNNYIDFDYTCPKCGAHAFHRHAFYERHVLYLGEDQTIHDCTLSVLRLKYTSCNSTHAILPSDVIPYGIYSLTTFLKITSDVLISHHTFLQTAQTYHISYQLISWFIKRLSSFEASSKLVLKELQIHDELTLSAMLSLIISRPTFTSEYFIHTRWAFLMQKFRYIFPKPVFLGSSLQ